MDGLMDKRRTNLCLKDPAIQFDVAHFLISNVIDGECGHPIPFLKPMGQQKLSS